MGKGVIGMTEKRYDVIYEKEPRGQVVTDNGIPCTARTCVTRLNRLTEENEQLKQQEKRLYKYFRKCFDNVSEQGFQETWEVVKKYD